MMGDDEIKEVASLAAVWWAERFKLEDRREDFRQILEDLVWVKLVTEGKLMIENDYDPKGVLEETLLSMGLPLDGVASGDPYLPRKHRMLIFKFGQVEARPGYGASWERLREPRDDTTT